MATFKEYDFPCKSIRFFSHCTLVLTTDGFELGSGEMPLNPRMTVAELLAHDAISFPSSLEDALDHLSENHAEVNDSQMQECLDALAAWVDLTNDNAPTLHVFDGYFEISG